ncbi:hypothetical protein SDC9_81982 [bioreactor metagenome]|uniref:Glycosyltransferase 2-like domain-containing protein n=1 Tax=bioreactor metagenome TaxID=1076179 RepID=A0A644Z5V5_9ZZZZ
MDSILTQTLENIEVILVDDGSTDASGKICDQYQKKFPSVFVIHQKNSGAAAARLAGVQETKGHYVGFVDSDDMISPFMYETLYSAAVQYQLDSAKIETGNLLSDKWPEYIASPKDFTVYEGDELRKKYIRTYLLDAAETISMCDKIVRREWLLSGNGEEEVRNTLEDFYINMNMALNYRRCGELKEIFYFVRYRKGSLSRRYNEDDFQVLLKGF